MHEKVNGEQCQKKFAGVFSRMTVMIKSINDEQWRQKLQKQP